MPKKHKKPKSYIEIWQSIRGNWGDIKPITKIIPDKRNKKEKHRKRAESNAE